MSDATKSGTLDKSRLITDEFDDTDEILELRRPREVRYLSGCSVGKSRLYPYQIEALEAIKDTERRWFLINDLTGKAMFYLSSATTSAAKSANELAVSLESIRIAVGMCKEAFDAHTPIHIRVMKPDDVTFSDWIAEKLKELNERVFEYDYSDKLPKTRDPEKPQRTYGPPKIGRGGKRKKW